MTISTSSNSGVREALTQAGQGVGSVDVHGAGTADTFSAAATEREGRVDLVLDADQRV